MQGMRHLKLEKARRRILPRTSGSSMALRTPYLRASTPDFRLLAFRTIREETCFFTSLTVFICVSDAEAHLTPGHGPPKPRRDHPIGVTPRV